MQGWIKLHRKIMSNPIWQNPYHFKLWSYCLMKASHKEHEQMVGNQIVKLSPGEFVTGRTSLADDLNRGMKPKERQSELSWWRYLKMLEKLEMLNIKSTTKYSVVSIAKWSEYQLDEQQTEQQMNSKCTTDEQQMNTNKNVKNGKNAKNEKKEKDNSPKQAYDESSIYFQLANLLFQKILENNPEHKQPNLQKWANTVRLMMERDNRTEKQIKYLINWSQTHHFWKSNILSTDKLRDKFDQLAIQCKNEHKGQTKVKGVRKEIVPDWLDKQKENTAPQSEPLDEDFEAERQALMNELKSKY